jgi:hypothetical protein
LRRARAKLDELLECGLVEPVRLLPADLGGGDDPRNVTWLPRACIVEMEAFGNRVREFVKGGRSARYGAVPEYDSDDFVPDRVMLSADLDGERITAVVDVRSQKAW